jgi:hypothetical protein
MSREIVTYGGYSFPYPKVTVREQFMFDADERTLIGTKYQISVTGWIHEAEAGTLRAQVIAMRGFLSKPWQVLKIFDGHTGDVLYHFDPNAFGGETATDDWSPRPEDLTISEITGMKAARYSWQVDIFKKDCPNLGTPNPILSVTKTFSYSIDVSGYATRQIAGTLKVRAQGAPADLYRSYVTPALPNRFRRTQQQFSQSPDCRTLTFSIVDVEEYRTLPPLVSDGEATFGVKVADLGARVFYTLQGRFKGPPSTPKTQLFTYLANLISAKFPLADPSFLFEEASVDESVYGNEIAFSIVGSGVAAPLPGVNLPNFTALYRNMTVPPPDSNGQAHLPSPYGDLPGYPHVSPLLGDYDACGTAPGEEVSAPDLVTVGRVDSPLTPDSSEDGDPAAGVSQQHRTTPFIAYHERANYHIDYKIVRMDTKDQAPDQQAAGPYLVSTAGPSMIVIQSGYFVCFAKNSTGVPNPPPPIVKFGRLLECFIQPHSPEPVQDGTWRQYTLHWRYVIDTNAYYHGVYDANAEIDIPKDMRLADEFTFAGFDLPWIRSKVLGGSGGVLNGEFQ